MRIEDLEQVTNIEKSIFSKPWSYKSFLDSVNLPDTIYVVASEEDEILGYCGLYCILNEGDISNVAVKEEYRKKGIGAEMLNFLMQQARKRGIESFTLEVRKSNESAIGLYKKLGFESAGIRKEFYERPTEDAVIMWKNDL